MKSGWSWGSFHSVWIASPCASGRGVKPHPTHPQTTSYCESNEDSVSAPYAYIWSGEELLESGLVSIGGNTVGTRAIV